MPIAFPLINGNEYDWSSVKIMINGVPYLGIREISYRSTLTPGKVYGTSAQMLGRTRGQLEHEGSFTMYRSQFGDLIQALSLLAGGVVGGYMEVAFTIMVAYEETLASGRLHSDTLFGCRIQSDDQSHTQGSEPLVVKADLSIMRIMRDQRSPTRSFL